MVAQWQGWIRFWQRRSRRGWQLRHLWVSLAVGLSISAIVSIAFSSYQFAHQSLLNGFEKNIVLELGAGVDLLDGWLETYRTTLEAIARTPTIRTFDREQVALYLEGELTHMEGSIDLSLGTSEGIAYTTDPGNFDMLNSDTVRQALQGRIGISDPRFSFASGKTQVRIAVPICSSGASSCPNRASMGFVVATIEIEGIVEVLESLERGRGSYGFILNRVGEPIIDPDRRWEDTSLLKSTNPNLQQIARRAIGRHSHIERLLLNGKRMYVAYEPLTQADWSIALTIPVRQLNSQLMRLNLLALVLGLLLAFAMGSALRQVVSAEKNRSLAAQEGMLDRLTGRIHASLDLERIVQTTVEELVELLSVDRAVFGWYSPEERILDLRWECARQGIPNHLGQFSVPLDFEHQLHQGDRIVLKCIDLNIPPKKVELDTLTYTALPVSSSFHRLGYLICFHAKGWFWRNSEQILLRSVANQLAIAITQSHMHAQAQTQVEQLNQTLSELKTTQTHLIQTEKMSGLGHLVAGIAHEINNPVGFIYGNLPYVSEYASYLLELIDLYEGQIHHPPDEIARFKHEIELDYIRDDLPEILTSMKEGADRIQKIILSLRTFSRLDEAKKKPVNIHEGIDSTLLLLNHRIKDKIKIVKNYAYMPQVECYAGHMNQVFLYLIDNAISALKNSSNPNKTITLSTAAIPNPEKQSIYISIVDNGPGIPAEILDKIFDPFFTTKPVGQGTGLGLSLSYQIIVDLHGGHISVDSAPGHTEVILEIPVRTNCVSLSSSG
ncbi:MAG: ATP-binding protein [Cyanobacteriota bacterium]|nr:ATP-binding protein [Cyanobacteriota bacterium]